MGLSSVRMSEVQEYFTRESRIFGFLLSSDVIGSGVLHSLESHASSQYSSALLSLWPRSELVLYHSTQYVQFCSIGCCSNTAQAQPPELCVERAECADLPSDHQGPKKTLLYVKMRQTHCSISTEDSEKHMQMLAINSSL